MSVPRPPPPGADPMLWQYFQAVDRDGNGGITADELQRVLFNNGQIPFNEETVRLMVGMFDHDQSGTINFNEFSRLWQHIQEWYGVFNNFDMDKSGSIDKNELSRAFLIFGYNLPEPLIDLLLRKYDRFGRGSITLDAFIQCCVTIRSLTESFQRFDTDRDGWINLDYHNFLHLVLANR
ncbi:hypothetical protein AMAG_02233 [Allomyces macrogynus ATCC 38327]|uniref:EF-hand domain-containing protein n=1 Tax=Allomyces macrogynus (strain ATCC 38327) TaxID=578462 RepID=A0A0L0S229_ALLM3|nr:hypothetical protein AMAG_02233 [Allomyces macrogynus ATCC 38327]|eukprot:KNE56424.1 hypothetical protein AMAG_02233 [Allomyces macrogynus ATCC 38327]